jgi:type I restriction enzyme S subunit
MPMFRIVDIDVTYLKWLIKSPLFRNRIKKIIPDGTAQKAIHEKVLLLESFIIPKDIKDQKIIANIVSLQFNEIELLESELEQTKEQKRGLMQLLLTGIVRVEVD